jgi:hypothetical protein
VRVRGTQSFVHMIGACAKRPGLLAIELTWRWGFGVLALAVLGYEGMRLLANPALSRENLSDFSFTNPLGAAEQADAIGHQLLPVVLGFARWTFPALAIGWAVASGLGRSLLLKRLNPGVRLAPFTLIALQLLRILALAAATIGWFDAVRWAASSTLEGAAPNLVAYFAWVICLSLGVSMLWALVSWIVSVAPLIAVVEGKGLGGSLVRSLRLGPLAGKLVEVNLVLIIVKLALIVFAIVLSSMPLPFAASMTGEPLYLWWVGVSVLYLVASDFFQVARLAVFLELWRAYG